MRPGTGYAGRYRFSPGERSGAPEPGELFGRKVHSRMAPQEHTISHLRERQQKDDQKNRFLPVNKSKDEIRKTYSKLS
jgi:hypothetical protein